MSLCTKVQSLWASPLSVGRTEESLCLKSLEVALPTRQDWSMETNYWRYEQPTVGQKGYIPSSNINKSLLADACKIETQ